MHPADEPVIDVADGIAGVRALSYHQGAPMRGGEVTHRIMVTHGHTYRSLAWYGCAAALDADVATYGHRTAGRRMRRPLWTRLW